MTPLSRSYTRTRQPSTLLIPHKRALLPPSTSTPTTCTTSQSSAEQTKYAVHRILHPSAFAGSARMKGFCGKSAERINTPTQDRRGDEDVQAEEDETENEEEAEEGTPRIEVCFSIPPQPFLDPPLWEALLRRQRHRHARATDEGQDERHGSGAGDADAGESDETAEQRRRRVERESEYGSMAIRGRSSVRARGRRPRDSAYWGGSR